MLAATYRRVLAEAEAAGPDRDEQIEAARRAFYTGFVAEAIAGYLAGAQVLDVTGERHRALLGYDDLARWQPAAEPPASLDYHGLTVYKTPPWGQGPVFLQQLALLSGFDLPGMGAGQRRVHPHRGGVRQAGLRGPGGVVRRPAVHRCPARRPALARVRGAAPRAGRRPGPGRPGPGGARRPHPQAARVRVGPARARPAPDRRRSTRAPASR